MNKDATMNTARLLLCLLLACADEPAAPGAITCDEGFELDDNGYCVVVGGNDICTPGRCVAANQSVCALTETGPTCLCDPGFTDDMGVCVAATVDPCAPNPCGV